MLVRSWVSAPGLSNRRAEIRPESTFWAENPFKALEKTNFGRNWLKERFRVHFRGPKVGLEKSPARQVAILQTGVFYNRFAGHHLAESFSEVSGYGDRECCDGWVPTGCERFRAGVSLRSRERTDYRAVRRGFRSCADEAWERT